MNLRSRLIRLAHSQELLRVHILPLLAPPPEWAAAAEEARGAALAAMPPCRCMGPKAVITDDGRGPILDVSYGHPLSGEDLATLEGTVGMLGWRAWAIGDRGIAFKPTWVRV